MSWNVIKLDGDPVPTPSEVATPKQRTIEAIREWDEELKRKGLWNQRVVLEDCLKILIDLEG